MDSVLGLSGRETNFVYSHRRTPGSVYRSHPKPEGVGFGGSLGKERLWLDDEFLTVTVQHHALDKTYHSGPLAPKQVQPLLLLISHDVRFSRQLAIFVISFRSHRINGPALSEFCFLVYLLCLIGGDY